MNRIFLFLPIYLLSVLSISVNANEQRRFCIKASWQSILAEKAFNDSRASSEIGCRYHADNWMNKVRAEVCSNNKKLTEIDLNVINQIKIPRIFYFTFDGAADFNAAEAIAVDPSISNIDGSEGSDLNAGYFNGGRDILKNIKELSAGLLYESRYYASSGFYRKVDYRSANSCAILIDEYLDQLERLGSTHTKPLIVVIGYSNGAIDALNLQNLLPQRSKRSVDLVLSIDPVAKAAKYHLSKLAKYAGLKHKSTGVLLNFYQNIDFGSLDLGIPYIGELLLRGKPIKNADLNFEYTLDNNDLFKVFKGAYSHIIIVQTASIWDRFRYELNKML